MKNLFSLLLVPALALSIAPAFAAGLNVPSPTVKGISQIVAVDPAPLVGTGNLLITSSNTVLEVSGNQLNPMPNFRRTVSNTVSGGTVKLVVNTYFADGGYSIPAMLPMTNISINGNGKTVLIITTNHNDQVFLYGNPTLSNVIFSNVWPNEWGMYPVNPSYATNVTLDRVSIYASGSALYSDNGIANITGGNCFLRSHVTNTIGVALGGVIKGTWTNSVFISDGLANQTISVGPNSTNALTGCTIVATNAYLTPTTNSQNLVVMGADPSVVAITNCTLLTCKGTGPYFDNDFSDCAFQVATYNESGQTLYVVDSFCNLAANGPMTMLGQLLDLSGGLTTVGPVKFINFYYWPVTNGVIFSNNNLPVTVIGGNLKTNNFTHPAKVTLSGQ